MPAEPERQDEPQLHVVEKPNGEARALVPVYDLIRSIARRIRAEDASRREDEPAG